MTPQAPGPTPVPPPASDRWLAVLRIAVGLWFLKTVVTKLGVTLVGHWLPVPVPSDRWTAFLPTRLAQFAEGNPLVWYRSFLVDFAVPHARLFAALTAFGEAAVGIGLTLGFLTRPAAVAGALLTLNYLLASFWMSPNQLGFHLLLLVCMGSFYGARAGLRWGLDGLLAERRIRAALPGLRPAAA